jgi:hypothetical protein
MLVTRYCHAASRVRRLTNSSARTRPDQAQPISSLSKTIASCRGVVDANQRTDDSDARKAVIRRP